VPALYVLAERRGERKRLRNRHASRAAEDVPDAPGAPAAPPASA
jgi:hypothetical protein